MEVGFDVRDAAALAADDMVMGRLLNLVTVLLSGDFEFFDDTALLHGDKVFIDGGEGEGGEDVFDLLVDHLDIDMPFVLNNTEYLVSLRCHLHIVFPKKFKKIIHIHSLVSGVILFGLYIKKNF